MEHLTLPDKHGMPLGFALLVTGALLLLLFLLLNHQNPIQMHKSKIMRRVVGDIADPGSTRMLYLMTYEEFTHLRLATQAAKIEAESYCLMPDHMVLETIEGNTRACAGAGIEIPRFEMPPTADLREFFAEREAACTSLLARMGEQPKGKLCGITPIEFMHLVTSIQAGCREAVLALSVSETVLASAFEKARTVRAGLGLPFVHPYERFGPSYHAFFKRRLNVLEEVLWRINRPYPVVGCDHC